MEKIIATEILNSIRKHLNNHELSDEEKLDYIICESMTKKLKLMQQAASPIEPLSIHIAKQLIFSSINDWSKEIARNYINRINRYLSKIKRKKYKIEFIKEDFDLDDIIDAKEIIQWAVEEVQDRAKKRKIKIPEIENHITPEQFMKIWEAFYISLLPNLGTDKDFTKEDVQNYIEYAVKKVGLRIKFIWK